MNDDYFALFDGAAAGFDPQPDVPRLEAMLRPDRRRRPAIILFSAAASIAVVGGATLAMQRGGSAEIQPGGTPTVGVDITKPPTTLSPEDGTKPPITEAPVTKPPVTDPPATQTPKTDPPATDPPPKAAQPPATTGSTQPPTTAPPTTAPPTTAPPTTAPPTTAPPTTSGSVSWSAMQSFGSCNDDPPYEVFYGTGNPGMTVSASSPYGSASTEVDEHGDWWMKVYFPSAPVNETFTINVSSAQGSSTFSFYRSE